MFSPSLYQYLHIQQGVEDLDTEKLFAQLAIKRLQISIISGAVWPVNV